MNLCRIFAPAWLCTSEIVVSASSITVTDTPPPKEQQQKPQLESQCILQEYVKRKEQSRAWGAEQLLNYRWSERVSLFGFNFLSRGLRQSLFWDWDCGWGEESTTHAACRNVTQIFQETISVCSSRTCSSTAHLTARAARSGGNVGWC